VEDESNPPLGAHGQDRKATERAPPQTRQSHQGRDYQTWGKPEGARQ